LNTHSKRDPEKEMTNIIAHGCAFAMALNFGILFLFLGTSFIYSQYSEYLPYATKIFMEARNTDLHSTEATKAKLLVYIPTGVFVILTYVSTFLSIKAARKIFARSK